eukprot:TRINITY_DN3692_c0_g1_i1.p1 TRINITY_DN3692_c0_g1~~TRINITY_DN3692_c0_g1_i1.p1  ORF type:complete len:668 (-),score=133.43 TRINITY_DN3692_c0_g1_i1:86-1840(-)
MYDFYTLPYLYGTRVVGQWLGTGRNTWYGLPADRVILQLCPVVPKFTDDNFLLVVEAWPTSSNRTCLENGCQDLNTTLGVELWTMDLLGNTQKLLNSSGTDCRKSISFNLAQARFYYPDGLYIHYLINPNATNITFNWELRIFNQNVAEWDGRSCFIPANASAVFAECRSSYTSIFTCTNGIYESSLEDCDILIDSTNCEVTCTCPSLFVPDGSGGCTTCGNGILELVGDNQEFCDTLLDPNCASDCQSCQDGFVFSIDDGYCVTCGNGIVETGEYCDYASDINCNLNCTSCTDGLVSDGNGVCTLCGNGIPDVGEICDPGISKECKFDCSSCLPPYASPIFKGVNFSSTTITPTILPTSIVTTGNCTLCGNLILDPGEGCDSADLHCRGDCSGCYPFFVLNSSGLCSRCGNGYLDAGETCDFFREGCEKDCQSCLPGLVAVGDRLGTCSTCGNGKIDGVEVCDGGLDPFWCSKTCSSCKPPARVVVGLGCVLCGNGRLDSGFQGEVCDSSQPGCTKDCQSCLAGWVPTGGKFGTCTQRCETCCGSFKNSSFLTPPPTVVFSSARGRSVEVVGLVFSFLWFSIY